MADTYYFPHDFNARTDKKIKKLLRTHRAKGYGIWWMIVEDLYNNNNSLPFDVVGLAADYNENPKIIASVLEDFELFFIENGNFSSESVKKRIEKINSKSEKARLSALSRHNRDANALPPQTVRNAIKESKVNESKESKTIEANASVGVPPTEDILRIQEQEKIYKDLTMKDKRNVYGFITQCKPVFIEPYLDLWNIWAAENGKPRVVVITDKRKRHFKARVREVTFDIGKILERAKKSDMCITSSWFNFDFLIKNQEGYLKLLEGNYDNPTANTAAAPITNAASEMEKRLLNRANGTT